MIHGLFGNEREGQMAFFLQTVWTSFTKLRSRRSFWGAEQAWIMIGTTVLTQNAKKNENAKKADAVFFYNMEIFAFWVITFEPIVV